MKVVQINLNHCADAQSMLEQSFREQQADVAIISEPYKQLDLPTWATDSSTKAAIWSCGKLPFQEAADTMKKGFVRPKIGGVYFYSCYVPPPPTWESEDFTSFINALTRDVEEHVPAAIAGDFYAWATDWGSKRNNGRGHILVEAMSLLDVILINVGDEPTSRLVSNGNDWKVTDEYTLSDHKLITWTVSTKRQLSQISRNQCHRGWKISVFETESFIKALDGTPTRLESVLPMVEEVMSRVTDACDVTMPRKGGKNNKKAAAYWWNNDIAALRKDCIQARRAETRGRKKKRPNIEELKEEHSRARLELVKAIKSSKRLCWTELVEEVDGDPWGETLQDRHGSPEKAGNSITNMPYYAAKDSGSTFSPEGRIPVPS
ncbi:uncharacterized protein LOC131675585 [Phymastichus coffea]|uniref:uncharacterized protein LOC131675585 n=1 Tax=Phymastichus coffea TaxID=108790 RepID=UPI00273B704A|nr:uncharacterized protein LOC131675585 [Phymastichus coffea]